MHKTNKIEKRRKEDERRRKNDADHRSLVVFGGTFVFFVS